MSSKKPSTSHTSPLDVIYQYRMSSTLGTTSEVEVTVPGILWDADSMWYRSHLLLIAISITVELHKSDLSSNPILITL